MTPAQRAAQKLIQFAMNYGTSGSFGGIYPRVNTGTPIDRMRSRLRLEVIQRVGPMELFPFGRPPDEKTLLDAFLRAFPEPVDGFRPHAIWIRPGGFADFQFSNGPEGAKLSGAVVRLTCEFRELNSESAREALARLIIDS